MDFKPIVMKMIRQGLIFAWIWEAWMDRTGLGWIVLRLPEIDGKVSS